MSSELQKLARKRNWLKFRLYGVVLPSINKNHPYTATEIEIVNRVNKDLTTLRCLFNIGSSSLGLKVKPRCFCGKVKKVGDKYCKKCKKLT